MQSPTKILTLNFCKLVCRLLPCSDRPLQHKRPKTI